MVPKEEQEMSISAMRTEEQAYLYCSDTTWITKMERLMAANPVDFTIHAEDEFGKIYRFPKKFITIRGKQTNRTMSEERKAELREQMKSLNRKNTDFDSGNPQ